MTAEWFFPPSSWHATQTSPSPPIPSKLCRNRQRDGINRQFGFGMRLEWKIHFNLLPPVWGSMMNTHDWYSKEANSSSLVPAQPTLAGHTALQGCTAVIYAFSLCNSRWLCLLTFILHWEKWSQVPYSMCMLVFEHFSLNPKAKK